MEDPETGDLVLVDTSSKSVRKAFAARAAAEQEELRRFLARTGIDTLSLDTSRPYIKEVKALFKRRANKR
jgi:uncharacterized protein (DUF58 family)